MLELNHIKRIEWYSFIKGSKKRRRVGSSPEQIVTQSPIQRGRKNPKQNEICPYCKSGKKFKKCHGIIISENRVKRAEAIKKGN